MLFSMRKKLLLVCIATVPALLCSYGSDNLRENMPIHIGTAIFPFKSSWSIVSVIDLVADSLSANDLFASCLRRVDIASLWL